jgi:hypothetical protein
MKKPASAGFFMPGFQANPSPVGAELARDGGGTFNINAS